MAHRIWILGAPDPEMEAIERLLVTAGEHVAHAGFLDGARGFRRCRPDEAYRATVHQHVTVCEYAHDIGETTWYLVECSERTPDVCPVVRIDHHRPGDPGFGLPPSEFLRASSIGQVVAELARLGVSLGESHGCGHYECDELCRRGIFRRWLQLDPTGGRDPEWIRRTNVGHQWRVCTVSAGETGDDGGPDCGEWVAISIEIALCAAADHCLGAAYRGECPGVDPDALMRWRAETRAAFQRRTT